MKFIRHTGSTMDHSSDSVEYGWQEHKHLTWPMKIRNIRNDVNAATCWASFEQTLSTNNTTSFSWTAIGKNRIKTIISEVANKYYRLSVLVLHHIFNLGDSFLFLISFPNVCVCVACVHVAKYFSDYRKSPDSSRVPDKRRVPHTGRETSCRAYCGNLSNDDVI